MFRNGDTSPGDGTLNLSFGDDKLTLKGRHGVAVRGKMINTYSFKQPDVHDGDGALIVPGAVPESHLTKLKSIEDGSLRDVYAYSRITLDPVVLKKNNLEFRDKSLRFLTEAVTSDMISRHARYIKYIAIFTIVWIMVKSAVMMYMSYEIYYPNALIGVVMATGAAVLLYTSVTMRASYIKWVMMVVVVILTSCCAGYRGMSLVADGSPSLSSWSDGMWADIAVLSIVSMMPVLSLYNLCAIICYYMLLYLSLFILIFDPVDAVVMTASRCVLYVLMSCAILSGPRTYVYLLKHYAYYHNSLQIQRSALSDLLSVALNASVLKRALTSDAIIADYHADDIVLIKFDIVGFTSMSAKLGVHESFNMLHDLYCQVDLTVNAYHCQKMYTIGDAYVVAVTGDRPAARAMGLVIEIQNILRRISDFQISRKLSPVIGRYGVGGGPVCIIVI